MSKLEQLIKSLIHMTERKNIKWTTTDNYSTQRGNKKFKEFINTSIIDLNLNPRISWTGEFYGNIGSVVFIYNKDDDKMVYNLYIQTKPSKNPIPVQTDDIDLELYYRLLDDLISSIKDYIKYN